MVEKRNILESSDTYTLSDFQKLQLAQSYKKLYSNTILENKRIEEAQYNKRVYNLSLKTLFENFFTVWTQIVNEMTTLVYDNNNNKNINNYLIVLTKDDRVIYLGLMFILLSLISYFIFLTK